MKAHRPNEKELKQLFSSLQMDAMRMKAKRPRKEKYMKSKLPDEGLE